MTNPDATFKIKSAFPSSVLIRAIPAYRQAGVAKTFTAGEL